MRLADLAVEPMRSIIAPYDAAAAGVSIAVEDLDGQTIVSAGTLSEVGGWPEVRVDIAASGRTIGQVVGRSSATQALVGALVAGVSASIGALAEAAESAGAAALSTPDVEAERDRLAAELALACKIQRSFVPLVPPTVAGYDLAGHYQAAREVGGDFFDIFPSPEAPWTPGDHDRRRHRQGRGRRAVDGLLSAAPARSGRCVRDARRCA